MSESSTASRILFLSGADMEPSAIRAAYPGARFIARARLDPAGGDGVEAEAETWGILIQVSEGGTGEARPVVADDGRAWQAVPFGEGIGAGDPAAELAAAMFWELPPAYLRRLRERAGVAEARAEDEEE